MIKNSVFKIITDDILLVIGSSVVVLCLIFLFPQFSSSTDDDSAQLIQYLTNRSTNQVLGVNSKSDNCPIDKPIVGWVNYEGEKIITYQLPENEMPSVCFKSIDDANNEGFVIE
jgi:hypothetical protein